MAASGNVRLLRMERADRRGGASKAHSGQEGHLIIAVDGPGSAGKSTVAKIIARDLGIIYIDTGAMYRAAALGAIRLGIGTGDEAAVLSAMDSQPVSISHDAGTREQRVFLGGEDVTGLIRAPRVSIGASDVSRIPAVRIRLVELQRRYAEDHPVIMDGRDIGTYVFPEADKKYYLTASPGERARRRYLELRAKGECATYEECLRDLTYRDTNDSSRAFAPLSVASDALYVETDNMIAREVADFLLADIKMGQGCPVCGGHVSGSIACGRTAGGSIAYGGPAGGSPASGGGKAPI